MDNIRSSAPLDRYGNPITPSIKTAMSALEENMIMQRPTTSNVMVI